MNKQSNPEAHLWAVAYDNVSRADEVREEIAKLGWGPGHGAKYVILLDMAVVVRHSDGSFTLDRKPFPGIANVVASTGVGFLVGLVLAAPLTGAAVGALLGTAGTAISTHAGIGDDFIRDVEQLMKPNSSVLFVLDHAKDMDVIQHTIKGLGGTVLMTNVDLERAKLIQSMLAASADKLEPAAN
jgi:uncharacterized membrane protein